MQKIHKKLGYVNKIERKQKFLSFYEKKPVKFKALQRLIFTKLYMLYILLLSLLVIWF